MILNFLRSKAGFACIVVLVCGVFFTLSKLKQRNAARAQAHTFAISEEPVTAVKRAGGAESAALLKRAQESARGRAEAVRVEAQRGSISSFDETGDAYVRRSTPDPIAHELINGTGLPAAGSDGKVEPTIVPSLRIRGRVPEETAAKPNSSGDPSHEYLAKAPSNTTRSAGGANGFDASPAPTKPQRFVPYGRLIKAELVITLESTLDEMPLVGVVVEPVYNNGRLVIPAGTEVHSMVRPDRIRNRLVSVSTWKLVFPREGRRPSGRQLTFEGIALDRDDRDGGNLTWGVTDGSFGLRGRLARFGQTSEELLLFAAEALKAASASMMDRQHTLTGSQVAANAKNAALAGGQAVLGQFAQRVSEEISRNGVYIQVPAGKQFYVYPKQIIDADRADIPTNVARVE